LDRRLRDYADPGDARAYGKRPATTRAEERAIRRLLAGEAAGGVVLDVPCGNGRLFPAISALAPRVCVGADRSPAMAALAGAVRPAVVADAARLPFRAGVFDVVLCVRLIHHFADPRDRRAVLSELARVSRGPVVFSCYSRFTLEGLRRRLRPKRASTRVGLSWPAVRRDAEASGLSVRARASLLPWVREQTFLLAVPDRMEGGG
jgi:SAM-dependent methyltransferase